MDAFRLKLTKIMLKNLQPMDFLILLFGFIYGNLFVITFSRFQWDFFFIFSLVLFLEILNKFFYYIEQKSESLDSKNLLSPCPKNTFFGLNEVYPKFFSKIWEGKAKYEKTQNYIQSFEKVSRTSQKSVFFFFQLFKRGFLLGFFVEAFKVGS